MSTVVRLPDAATEGMQLYQGPAADLEYDEGWRVRLYPTVQVVVTDEMVEKVAREFHDAYEEAAYVHGWGTNKDCRVPFDNLPEANRLTMLDATIAALRAAGFEEASLRPKKEDDQ